MIEGHGDDLWRYGGHVRHNFSTNIHSSFDHHGLLEVLANSAATVGSYPEPEPVSVERLLATITGVAAEEVMVTNGATEAIYLLARSFAGATSVIMSPTFREYQDACTMHGHKVRFISSLSEVPSGCGMVWVCNPNNPTGRVTPRGELLAAARANPETVFIVDQAYSDYTLLPVVDYHDAVDVGNMVILGSLTKRFGVPGLRVGYAVGSASVLSRVKGWRMPWSVGGLAIEGALYLLRHMDDYRIDAEGLHSEALRIVRELREAGISASHTDCNFLLCRLPRATAADLKEYLVREAGILIRDASNFEGLTEAHFRVAAQTPEENDLLIEEIKKWLAGL